MTTGCFQESKFHWPLSGNEFEERTVSSRPTAAGQAVRGSMAGNRVEQSLVAVAQGQQLGHSRP